MSDNKKARIRLEKMFGKICMIEAAGIRCIPKEERKKIKGYKKYEDQITFHHIKERCKGGAATTENGALVKGYNHIWLHSLPEDEKEAVNKKLIQFKIAFLSFTDKGIEPMSKPITIDFDVDKSDCITIPAYDITREEFEKRSKFNRAKAKQETRKLIDEQLDEDDYFER